MKILVSLATLIVSAPLLVAAGAGNGALPANAEQSPIRSWFIAPTRVVWQSGSGVMNAANLLQPKPGQAVLKEPQPPCVLTATDGKPAGIMLDFGTELHGSVEIFTPMTAGKEPRSVRVRLGESVSEAMAELGERGAQNDHAVRDQSVLLPWLGKKTVGPSGFRFVRIDALDPKTPVSLSQVRAVLQMRDLQRAGSFRCSDERLNKIWETGAYTVQLNMQEYLWDGIKRDRLVWIGDMHPEVSTINAVFGFNDVVPKSLDLTRDVTPVTQWMNGISSYSMWWVLIQEEMWMHHGNRKYLDAQNAYLKPLLRKLADLVGPDGREHIDGMRFLDWPSSPNQQGVTAGLQGLLVMTLESGARLMHTLGDEVTAKLCTDAAIRGRTVVPDVNASKSGAALLSLAGMLDAKKTSDDVLKIGGVNGISTFYGFYVLQALAKSGDTDTALDFISTYWGAMLDFGATTFWEDFDLAWTEGRRAHRRTRAARKKGSARRLRRLLLSRIPPQLLSRMGERADGVAQSKRARCASAGTRLQARPHRTAARPARVGRGCLSHATRADQNPPRTPAGWHREVEHSSARRNCRRTLTALTTSR